MVFWWFLGRIEVNLLAQIHLILAMKFEMKWNVIPYFIYHAKCSSCHSVKQNAYFLWYLSGFINPFPIKCSTSIPLEYKIEALGENDLSTYPKLRLHTASKVYKFGVFLVCIFPNSDWIRRDREYLSVFSPNVGKYGPEKLRIRTFITQCTHYKLSYLL